MGAQMKGRTPLHISSQIGDETCVDTLLLNGANVSQTDEEGCTPLYIAAGYGHFDCVERILAHKDGGVAIISQAQVNGRTPLFVAVRERHYETAKLLISEGADVNQGTKKKLMTPLHVACQMGELRFLHIILDVGGGVDVNKTMEAGMTPLFIASQFDQYKCVEALIKGGADVNKATNRVKSTPLFVAAEHGSRRSLNVLLKCNETDVNKTN